MGDTNRLVQQLESDKDYIRFWSKAKLTANDALCWVWQFSKSNDGYGNFQLNKLSEKANRVAYLSYYGVNPGSLCVLHTCDNPSCINPKHLFLGTRGDNNSDCVLKGRKAILSGELSGSSKLSEAEVLEIFSLFENGVPRKDISKIYDISESNLSFLLSGKRWKHLKRNFSINRISLNEHDVLKIRELSVNGNKNSDIAKRFGTNRDHVYRIVSRKIWKHIN